MEPSLPPPPIRIQSLTKCFGDFTAVKSLSLDICSHEIFGLLGPNGAGKTTALRMLATLMVPTSGSATIMGYDVQHNPLQVRSNIGYLTGDTGLYGKLTPRETLVYFGQLHGLAEDVIVQRTQHLVTLLQMEEFEGRHCEKLSTGQRQRVSIARTLVHDPPVLILDEPTSGLDIISAGFIHSFLSDERKRGKTILISTHGMAEAELLCDRIAFLYQGEILSCGARDELLQRYGAPTLANAFINAINGNPEKSRG